MKLGIISDTHGDVRAWQKAVEGPFREVELILHAGDILYHGPKNPMVAGYGPAPLAEALNRSTVPVIFARGNCDSPVDQLVINFPIQEPYAFVQIEDLRLLVHHGDGLSREEKLAQAKRHRAQIFVFGHTHIPCLENEDGVLLFNPGSPALPKSSGPTVGRIDTQTRTAYLTSLLEGNTLMQVQF